MLKKVWMSALAFSLILALTSCGSLFKLGDGDSPPPASQEETPTRPAEYPVNAFDITVESRPQAIVSLSSSVTDKLFEMGFGDRLRGISESCEEPDGESRTRCGSVQMPDLDAIEDLSPHIVLTDAPLSQATLNRLEGASIQVALVEKARDLTQLKSIYVALAQLLNGEKTGEAAGTQYFEQVMEKKLSELSEKAQETPPNAVFIKSLDTGVATGDTLESTLLGLIGLSNVAQDYTEWNIPAEEANSEAVREKFRSIDFIYMDRDDMTIKDLEKSAFWKGLNAVLKDYYLYVDRGLFDRQSFKMLEELGRMQQYANGEIESSRSIDYPDAPAQPAAPASLPDQEPSRPAASTAQESSTAPASSSPAESSEESREESGGESSEESSRGSSSKGEIDGEPGGDDLGDGGSADFTDDFYGDSSSSMVEPGELDT